MLLIWGYALQIKAVSENTNPLYKKGMLVQLGMIPIVFSLALLTSFVSLDIAQYFWLVIIPVYIVIRQKFRH